MPRYVSRILSSFVSLVLLLVMVFFLSRLTGDPAALFLPIDATPEMIEQLPRAARAQRPADRAVRGYVWDVLTSTSARACARRGRRSRWCCQAFVWTLWLALITMLLVTAAAIVIGSLAAFRPGGVFDRIVTFTSLIGASAPGLLDRHRRHHRLRHRPRLAADERHRHGLALDPADRRAVHPAVRADPAGGARLDGAGLRLGLCQDRPGQGRAATARSSSCTRSGTPCCR